MAGGALQVEGRGTVSYALSSFLDDLDDLDGLVGAAAHGEPEPHCIAPLLDGRAVLIHAEALRGLPAELRERAFDRKYGSRARVCRHRFDAVMEFVTTWRDDLLYAGLAKEGPPLAVREEFVDHLLKALATHEASSKSEILRFLDEWGHRWM